MEYIDTFCIVWRLPQVWLIPEQGQSADRWLRPSGTASCKGNTRETDSFQLKGCGIRTTVFLYTSVDSSRLREC